MNGYLRVAAISPKIAIGNVNTNLQNIVNIVDVLNTQNVNIVLTSRLALTSVSLSNLFYDENILSEVEEAVFTLVEYTKEMNMVLCITCPFKYENNLYETCVVINKGKILGIVPNDKVDNKIFSNANDIDVIIKKYDKENNKNYFIPFNRNLIFTSNQNENIKFAITFGDNECSSFANIILNPNDIKETYDVNKYYNKYKYLTLNNKQIYVVASSSFTESTTNYIYKEKSMIYEIGELVNATKKLGEEYVIGDIDIDKIAVVNNKKSNDKIDFNKEMIFDIDLYNFGYEEQLYRMKNLTPFIEKNMVPYNYTMHIVEMLAIGLYKRYLASKSKSFVLGLSGGLDSTMALLVIRKTCDMFSLPFSTIKCVTMPCFASSSKSIENANILCRSLGIEPINIDIRNEVEIHLNSINHNLDNKNVTYENAQARTRTMVLMDIANDTNGIVVGTSDLSEIAIGFSTYNGDHMSMYNVNSSLSKTLIKYMLKSIADYNIKNNTNVMLSNVLYDILNQPISPELVSDNNSYISQKTEEIVGPYVLIDFYLYNYLMYHYSKEKLLDLALRYFCYNDNVEDKYDETTIKNTLDVFMRRFYQSQYKRNTSPDGPYIGYPNLNSKLSFVSSSDLEID